MRKLLFFLAILLSQVNLVSGQCIPGFSYVAVRIVPDNFPGEISWKLTDGSGTVIMSGLAAGDSVCIPDSSCLKFRIDDTYGDGICCLQGNGSYTVLINGVVMATGGQYTHFEEVYIGCPAGSYCNSALPAYADTVYQAAGRSTWYEFTPDSSGTYNISTCFPSNLCDTRLWVYDHCSGLIFDSTNIGAIIYNDNSCGNQAFISAGLHGGDTYYIRVGGNYTCTDSVIAWQITYGGPIVGCMDSAACNYDPLAVIDNGSCIYPGDPACNHGPDLQIDQNDLQTGMYVTSMNSINSCLIGEGCLGGYGQRYLLNFTTTINNIGDQDYYIGQPVSGNSQFVFDQCHGHWHYAGYASYDLYDSLQRPIAAGFKNGFCVLDLMCFGGTAKYTCSDMGISAGCADSYSSGLSCQWIDITDVTPGKYTLVVKVNWDRSPDKLGRIEQRYDNNVGFVCLNITRNLSNTPVITVLPNCLPVLDCAGDTFGLALPDCDGICNGSKVTGDLNADSLRNLSDLEMYMDSIVWQGAIGRCNDLNADSLLTVADAALMNACIRNNNSNHTHSNGAQNTHRHCEFPFDILNTTDIVKLGIATVNSTSNYVDIALDNRDCDLTGIQFSMSGLNIDSVKCLAAGFQPVIRWNSLTGIVMVLDTSETYLPKNTAPVNAFRIYYSTLTSNMICITSIADAVNGDYERTVTQYLTACAVVSGIDVAYNSSQIQIHPNPSNGNFNLHADVLAGKNVRIEVTEISGRKVKEVSSFFNGETSIDLSEFPDGIYLIKLQTENQIYSARIVKI